MTNEAVIQAYGNPTPMGTSPFRFDCLFCPVFRIRYGQQKPPMASQKELKMIGERLHYRVLGGTDLCVSAELSECFLPLLKQALTRRFHNLADPHLAETFAIDSLLKYLASPERFHPEKSSLIGYLYIDAFGDLLNYLEKHKKFVEHHLPVSDAERQGQIDYENPETIFVERSASLVEEIFARITDPKDIELIELLLQREHRTEPYAEVLGIQELSKEQQFAEVKRHKDRLKSWMKRHLEKSFGKQLDSLLRYSRSQKSPR